MADHYLDALAGDDTTGDGSQGSPWKTVAKGVGSMAAADTLYVKASATYPVDAALSPPAGLDGRSPTRIIGYIATPGDGGQAAVRATAALTGSATPYVFNLSNNFVMLVNLAIDGADGAGGEAVRCVSGTGSYNRAINCVATHFNGHGFYSSGIGSACASCRATAGGGTAGFAALGPSSRLLGCVADANTCTGFYLEQAATLLRCVAANNTGAASDGFLSDYLGAGLYHHCVAHGNGRDGLRLTAANSADVFSVLNCLFTNNGGYGVNDTAAAQADSQVDFCAYFGNGLGARNNIKAGPRDVAITGVPFLDPANLDFRLNSVAGRGLACQAAAFPTAWPGLAGTNNLDLGLVQHQDSGGGGGVSPGGISRSRMILGA